MKPPHDDVATRRFKRAGALAPPARPRANSFKTARGDAHVKQIFIFLDFFFALTPVHGAAGAPPPRRPTRSKRRAVTEAQTHAGGRARRAARRRTISDGAPGMTAIEHSSRHLPTRPPNALRAPHAAESPRPFPIRNRKKNASLRGFEAVPAKSPPRENGAGASNPSRASHTPNGVRKQTRRPSNTSNISNKPPQQRVPHQGTRNGDTTRPRSARRIEARDAVKS